jgi:porin
MCSFSIQLNRICNLTISKMVPGIQVISFVLTGMISTLSMAQEAGFGGPDAVPNQLNRDEKGWGEFKEGLAEDGLRFTIDYSAITLSASDSLEGADDHATGGMFRFYGQWDLIGKGTPNTGALIWKVEQRHAGSDTAPNEFLFGAGASGVEAPPFNDDKGRLTNFYWKQRLNDGRATVIAGMMDVTDYVDVYLLSSPWTGFVNFAFSTGTTTIALPGDAALGVAGATMIRDQFFVIGGLTDMNSKPTDPTQGFDSFFNDNKYFKSVELGWTDSHEKIYTDNIHVTLWHADESDVQGTEDGYGYNLSASRLFGKWLPFVRGGYSKDAGTLSEKSISIGTGYLGLGGEGNKLGIATNWSEIDDADDQYTTEIFYLFQVTSFIEVTPDIQWIKNPALNPDENSLTVVALRARAFF